MSRDVFQAMAMSAAAFQQAGVGATDGGGGGGGGAAEGERDGFRMWRDVMDTVVRKAARFMGTGFYHWNFRFETAIGVDHNLSLGQTSRQSHRPNWQHHRRGPRVQHPIKLHLSTERSRRAMHSTWSTTFRAQNCAMTETMPTLLR